MLRFGRSSLSPTLEYLKTCPRVMSDTLQATKSGKNEKDDTAYDLVMKHTAKKKYNFHWAPHLGENRYTNVMKLRVGYDGFNQPWYLKTPKWHEENRYTRHDSKRREYVPLTLYDLQRAIDLGRLDLSKPVDLCALQNAHVVRLASHGPKSMSEFGVNLVSQGADSFKAKGLCLEVQ